MVKYMAWIERGSALPVEEADWYVRKEAEEKGFIISPQSPLEYWRKEGKTSVQISSEQFPGSQPIWLWEA